MQTLSTAGAGGPVVSNSLGFYWSVLSAAGPGGSLDLGRMCPLPEPSTLAKNFQTRGRHIFSHGSCVLAGRAFGKSGGSKGKLAMKQTTKYGRRTVATMGSPFSTLVLYPQETLDRMHVT